MRLVVVALCLLCASSAAAQGRTLVFLPDQASRRLEEALQIALQLSGRDVAITRGRLNAPAASELAWLAEGEVLLVRSRGREIEVVAMTRGGRARAHYATASARAIALLAVDLLETVEPAPELGPEAAPAAELVVSPRAVPLTASAESLSIPLAGAEREMEPESLAEHTERFVSEPAPLPPAAERVGFEILGALLSGTALGVSGALVADALAGEGDSFPWWAVGLTVMGTTGATVGALLAGRLTGAQGDPYWTLAAGVLSGVLAGLVLVVGNVTDLRPDDGVTSGWTYLGAALAAALPTTLSVLAFEWSMPQRPAVAVRVSATGLSGSF